uniref:Adaptor related protein complex 3 subunit beta 1 n=1 Tax=Cyprinus carpio TaxID=7962 RepID=A0A8C1PMY4_CYPCA
MLESNKESLKLEAMKRIVGLIAKGKNASELFPAVVKNVASKNIELKKLVYVYLVRYAEEQQDLALLSISTFQRALKDPNQLIRASALRVLSSIRVPIIVPIMMLAIKEAATDLSPYVRKTAAHAIQKLYSLDPDQKEHLIEVIEKLLKDKSTVKYLDIHTNMTKMLLVIKMVVMAVSQLYWHLAPKHELSIITKSLVRLLRSHREVQYIVLQNIATMSIQRKGMFEPFMKSFYVRSTDATHIKTLKLEILTNLANEANISTILREFQTYVKSQDKAFAAATIQAIGRCATNISEVTDTCLNGLVLLLSNRDETVVAESVVVIKKLLQTQPSQHSDIIKHMAKLFDNITVPMARASILWLMGEYCEHVPKIAPDVLRKMAKTFTNEEDIVKLQIVNLAAKLYLTNSKQTKLLTQYILNLGKYDQNYDIRDRTRFIRQLIVPNEKSGALSKYARRILMAPKPAPVLQSAFKDRDRFQLGTLSHTLNSQASGYLELSDWPAVAPDQSVRNVEVVEPVRLPCIFILFYFLKIMLKMSYIYKLKWPKRTVYTQGSDLVNSNSSVVSVFVCGYNRKQKNGNAVKVESRSESESGSESSSSESSSESGSELDSDSDSGTDQKKNTNFVAYYSACVTSGINVSLQQVEKKEVSLLDLDDCEFSPVFVPETSHELLHRMTGKGLSAQYRFTRQPCIYGNSMVSLQLTLSNSSDQALENIHISEKSSTGQNIHRFNAIGERHTTKEDEFSVSIQPAVGELLLPITMSEADFTKEQGNTNTSNWHADETPTNRPIHFSVCISRFAGKTVSSGSLVLVSVALKDPDAVITINTEKTVIGSMLLRQFKTALTNSGP